MSKAILWMDNRATKEALEIQTALENAKLPQKLSSEQMAPKLLWLARHRPNFTKGRILECITWLVFRLTGNLSVSSSITNFAWGVTPRQWKELRKVETDLSQALQAIDIPVKASTCVAGFLTATAASKLGLGAPRKPITVAVGGNDGLLSSVATGLLNKTPTAAEVGGTSYVLASKTTDRNCPDSFRPSSLISISSIESAGLFLTWFQNILRASPNELEKVFAKGKHEPSTISIDLDLLGQKDPKATLRGGSLSGLRATTTREDLLQAIVEKVAISASQEMEKIFSKCNPIPKKIIISGGFSQNRLFKTLRASLATASKTKAKVYAVKEKDVGCLGAAMCAGCAAGEFKNLTHASRSMSPKNYLVKGLPSLGKKLLKAHQLT